jgi:hypothetical protein
VGRNPKERVMNKYGALLMRQWKRADPQRFSEIPDPEAFFSQKGQELEQEISTLAQSLAGPDRPGESYMEKVARLSTARFNAESDLLREAMIPEPDDVETPLRAEWRSVAWEDPADE